jgi:GT2 family glycosyltransferase/ubiquinone/menaquinone biosynthesis C-methylase UbiE
MLEKDNASSDLDFTGERYVPSIGGDIELEHLHRYRVVEAIVAGKVVADIACGEGYGSNLMAEYAASVVGVDISTEAVDHARRTYSKSNLTFVCAPGQDTQIPAQSIDVVVSFETIEHHDQHQEMLQEIKRILKPGGTLIMSSPDKLECTDKTGLKNPHHVKELYKYEFESLIKTYFKNYELYGQRVITGSAIFAQGLPIEIRSYSLDKIDECYANVIQYPMYWIAIASDSSLIRLPGGMLEVDVSIDGLRLAEYENEIRKKTIAQRDNDAVTFRERITFLEEDRQAVHSHLTVLELKLSDKNSQLENAHEEVQRLLKKNQEFVSSTSWRLTAPIRLIKHILSGEWAVLGQIARFYLQRGGAVLRCLIPDSVLLKVRDLKLTFKRHTSVTDSSMNQTALGHIVANRFRVSQNIFARVLKKETIDFKDLPRVDISLVTYNSGKWLKRFFDSIEKLQYPHALLMIYVVDNGSSDDTLSQLIEAKNKLKAMDIALNIMQGPNVGFGAGHNCNIKLSKAPLLLVSNVDLFFEPDAFKQVVMQAMRDDETVAAWEFRQKPYEHPKYYDPVSGFTNWNSHACVLLRRRALEMVGGYDEVIFMYGEDVDLSYNLRAHGYFLKYCPNAVVWHDTYESAGQLKPLQYVGSTFASLYLRLKYGTWQDVASVPALHSLLIKGEPAYPEAHTALKANRTKLIVNAVGALFKRKLTDAHFPFRGFDYELTRAGAFHKLEPIPAKGPLVSIITRTYRGRTAYLQEAIISVANQTYPNIEHIVVEDGGNTYQTLCENAVEILNPKLNYISLDKVGRSKAGNKGLAAAQGRYCLFLDDDDLLYSDHIEVLLAALLNMPQAVAAYSPAMEVHTHILNKNTGEYIETEYSFPEGLFQEYSFDKLQQHNYIAIQSILFDKKLYELRGGFDESLEYLEDWNLWVRYGWNNMFVYAPKLTSMYRVPSSAAEFQRRFDLLNGAYASVSQSNAAALSQFDVGSEPPTYLPN